MSTDQTTIVHNSLSNGKSNHNDEVNCQNQNSSTLAVDVTIDINDIYDGALQVIKRIRPSWQINSVKFKIFTDGCTNKLIGCYHIAAAAAAAAAKPTNGLPQIDTDDVTLSIYDVILVRIYGKNTEVLIDRKKEIINFQLLHSYGFAPKLLATFNNGLAYEYCQGEPVSKSNIYDECVWQQVAKRMAEMHRDVKCASNNNNHSCIDGIEVEVKPMLWKKINQMFNLIPATFGDAAKQQRREELLPSLDRLKQEFDGLHSVLSKIDNPVVFAHNDLLLGNILYDDSKDKVIFIDYEYADYNFQAYDIGDHFAEFAGMTDIDYSLYPSKEFQLKWLQVYLTNYHKNDGVVVNDDCINRLYAAVNKFALAAHFFWLLWAHNQAEYSEIDYDFIEFASLRYNEYMAKKDIFLSL